MSKIKYMKLQKKDGNMTDYIPIGADAVNVDLANGTTVEEAIGTVEDHIDATNEIVTDLKNSVDAIRTGTVSDIGKALKAKTIDQYGKVTEWEFGNVGEADFEALELEIQQLAEQIAADSGLYVTKVINTDGSVVYYAHNKSMLENSNILLRFTTDSFAISTDGGETYPYNLDISSRTILNKIYMTGLDANHITTGSLIGKDSQGNTVFSFNIDTGQIWIKSSQINVNTTQSLDDILSAMNSITGNAVTTAQNAIITAGNAQTAAINAITTAQNAVASASSAQTTATNAVTTAQNAITTAGNATQIADNALIAAQSIEENAKALVVTLSKDNFVISTNSNGTEGDYTGCFTTINVQWGNTDVTSEANITILDGAGVVFINDKQLIIGGKSLKVYGGDVISEWDPETYTYTIIKSMADIAITTFIISYNGKTITKQLNIVKAMQGMQGLPGQNGQNGKDGKDGAAGISVISVDVWYAISDSSTIAPISGWSTNQPQWEDGKYIWFKTLTAYSTGETSESEPACITGSAGYPGETGVGIDSIEEQYYLHTSDTATPDPDSPLWTTTPTWESGKYLWSRLKITYDDAQATVKYTDPVLSQAINDANQRAEDVQTELNNMEIGGVNLIRVANTLLFDNYYFSAHLFVNNIQLMVNKKKLYTRIAP